MAPFEKPERVQEAQFRRADFFPFLCNRAVSFRVKAWLRSASFAESLVDLGDRWSRPVLEKVGSGL